MVFGDKWQKWFGELDEKARKVAVGLPAAALEFDVAGPRDAASGLGVLARIQKAMPVGWKIEGILIPAEKIRGADMSDGRCVVPGCTVAVRLVHRPVPGCLVGDMTYLRLDVTPDHVPAETEREQELVYLGRGPLGHAYLTGDVGGRWSHAAYDIAMAVGVTEQGPQKPDGPDWGRTVSRILWKCYKKVNDEDARTSPWEHLLGHAHLRREATELARIEYTQNLVPPTKTQPAAREDPQHPYYRFHLSVRPTTAEHQLDMDTADRAIKWDGASVTRGYTVKRLGVDIVVTVLSDDAAFVAALNDVVDREITRVLALPGPASP
jgi:hypothetical protein